MRLRMKEIAAPLLALAAILSACAGATPSAATSPTVAPLPIGWAEHVQAEGHWGSDLRAYMRDYNHWTVLGVLCELMPQPENRVTLAAEKDRFGMPVANFGHSLCDNDKTARQLTLSWGVTPFVTEFDFIDPQNTIETTLKNLASQGHLNKGETVVIIGAISVGTEIVDAVQMRTV